MRQGLYADSSFLVSLACKDSNSKAAGTLMQGLGEPLPFTPLHRIEARNAIRNAAMHQVISQEEKRAALRQLDQDLQEGLLIHRPVPWTEVFRLADELSEKQAQAEGQRTIDLLHVAMALELDAKTFLTFDKRQKKLAKAVGLNVRPS